MNGAADMGGMHGFGPVVPEANEPVFHADWEKKAFALNIGVGVANVWNLDTYRFVRESIPPPLYLNLSYYGLWVEALTRMMVLYGVATPEEIKAGHAIGSVQKHDKPVTPEQIITMVRCGHPYTRNARTDPLFAPGDKVRTKNMHPHHHTRLPRYARGHVGEIVRIVGCHVFPDSNASEKGEDPHWLYTVRFDGRELWGPDSDPSVRVCIEAWEPYLEKP